LRRFVPLARKVNFILVSSLALGIGAAIVYLAYAQNRDLRRANAENLQRQSEILYQSIKNAMLPGEAPVAVRLFADIRQATGTFEVNLYRADGVEAFSDNRTIEMVNANLGKVYFQPKRLLMPDARAIAQTRRQLGLGHRDEARPHPDAIESLRPREHRLDGRRLAVREGVRDELIRDL